MTYEEELELLTNPDLVFIFVLYRSDSNIGSSMSNSDTQSLSIGRVIHASGLPFSILLSSSIALE